MKVKLILSSAFVVGIDGKNRFCASQCMNMYLLEALTEGSALNPINMKNANVGNVKLVKGF